MSTEPVSTAIITQSPSVRLVRLRLAIGLIKTAGTYTIGALMGLDWGEMTHQQQFLIVVAGVVALATHVEAFNDKTSARAEQGKTEQAKKAGTAAPMPIPPTV